MATTTPTPLPESIKPSPDAGPRGESRRRLGSRRAWLVGAAVLTAAAAVVTLVVLTVSGHDDDTAPLTGVHSGLVEHGSIRAIEGSVEDTADVPAHSVDPALAEAAEQYERQTHLEGQAATYGEREPEIAVNPNGPGVPASEHAADGAGG
jgi:hypothetical protein